MQNTLVQRLPRFWTVFLVGVRKKKNKERMSTDGVQRPSRLCVRCVERPRSCVRSSFPFGVPVAASDIVPAVTTSRAGE
jgi:hypothetical protein